MNAMDEQPTALWGSGSIRIDRRSNQWRLRLRSKTAGGKTGKSTLFQPLFPDLWALRVQL
jgi:hypothetical protein